MSTPRLRHRRGTALIVPFIMAVSAAVPVLATPVLATPVLTSAVLAAPAPLAPLAPPSSEALGSCADDQGVTVVVDFTDVGGDIVVACSALDPSSGREALEAAGFTITESQPGLICAIDDRPDPCPETFDGSFWSYWHSTPDGDWTSYLVGADASDPAPGELEGWRYNDGGTGPGLAPAEVASSLLPAPSTPMPSTPRADDVESAPTAPSMDAALLISGAGMGALVMLAVILLRVRSRRRRASGVVGAASSVQGSETDDDAP